MPDKITLKHIFVDHSNIWGGARLAFKIKNPELNDADARLSIRKLDTVLGGRDQGVTTKIVSGGIPPGMETVWTEYQKTGYDTQRLFRDDNWHERGVDHSLIGHIWRLAAKYRTAPTQLVLASGDGKANEFKTSFFEVLELILTDSQYASWAVTVASFDWETAETGRNSPTATKIKNLVKNSPRASFINLYDSYDKIVFHQPQLRIVGLGS